MTQSPKSSSGLSRSFVVLVFLALVAAACGSSTTEANTDPNGAAEVAPLSVDVDYGATLDEWSEAAQDAGVEQTSSNADFNPDYRAIEWNDLVPEGFSSDEIWAKYDDEFAEVEFGTPEETALYEKVQAEIDPDVIEPALEGEKVRMTGFVAPLTYDGDIVTEFLLVPYFGACIHVPPPPANQTVLVTVDVDNGFTTEDAWGAVWVEGTVAIESGTTDLGLVSYKIDGDNSGVHDQF